MSKQKEYGLPDDQKPDADIIGGSGNVFGIMGTAARALRHAGFKDEAKEMQIRIMGCGSYDEALQIVMHYVNPTSQ